MIQRSDSKALRVEGWRRIGIAALGVLALASYIVLVSLDLQRARERESEAARQGLSNLVKVLEHHALASVDKIDTTLVASRLHIEDVLAGKTPGGPEMNAKLRTLLDQIPESQSLRVANAQGRFIHDATGQVSNATILDRDYFLRNQADASGRLVISEPLFARITSNWVITLSRRLTDRQGEFAGLVQAAMRADYFQDFYASLNLGTAHTVTLFDDQLRLVARFPPRPEQLGKPLGSATLRQLMAADAQEALYSAESAIDGVHRLYAMRKVNDHPLFVLVGRSTEDYLSAWHRQVRWSIAGMVALGIVMAGWIAVWLRTYDAARQLAKTMTQAYETTMRRTRALLDSLPDPAWLSDRDQRMIAVNEAYARACGRDHEQVVGRTVAEIWSAETARAFAEQDAATLASQRQQRREAQQEVAGGAVRCFEYISTPVLDEDDELVGVAGVARDITQIRADEERIRHLAEHDILTDLPNRALLGEHMSAALAATVGAQAEIALLFLDLDHFKDINDTLGHEIGDQLLLQVAQRLRANVHESDTVSRQGGDEFAILLRGYSSLSRVASIAQRLIDALVPPFQIQGHELQIGASIGISTYPQDGADIGTLLKNADAAMYQAKAGGGNAYQFFTAEMNTRILERVAMENNLRRALANHEFTLHYQPQVDGANGRVVGVEALIRWHHPELGDIPPARFIPIAEESGLINGIGEWVLREACRQMCAWQARGFGPLQVAVNLSAVQFRQRDLVLQVSAILAETGLAPRWLELEITESAFIHDTARIVGILAELRSLGIKLAVDDFGTGYSSLGYLKHLPFDKIKIDQSFVRDLPDSDDDIAITEAIIGIASSLKKELIAEGVEQAAQKDFLLQRGCHLMQGFHFSRPVPPAAIEAMLERAGND
jgi:diguanylate cyclase (GGDEF)-like protein/PAS domain S-box-containing protein